MPETSPFVAGNCSPVGVQAWHAGLPCCGLCTVKADVQCGPVRRASELAYSVETGHLRAAVVSPLRQNRQPGLGHDIPVDSPAADLLLSLR